MPYKPGKPLPQDLGSSDSPTFTNCTLSGDLTLDDGGSIKEAGGTAAITIDAAGQVTKIGQTSPSDTHVLTWDQTAGYWKAAAAAGASGDITAVTAGDGLTGGATSGAATLAVGAGTGIDVSADAIAVDVSDFMANGADNRILTASSADAMNAEENLQFDGTGLKIKEAAAAAADTAAYGQLWVKTATPNELYFTTDAGDDIQITTGTAIAGGGGGIAADDENLILHMQVFA